MKKSLLLATLLLVFSSTSFAQGNRVTSRDQRENLRGKAVSHIDLVSTPRSLDEMVGASDLIIEGVVESVVGSRRSGSTIETDVKVSVIKSLKGVVPKGKDLVVSQLGGKVDELEIEFPQVTPMQVGEKYVLFLEPDQRGVLHATSVTNSSVAPYQIYRAWHGKFKVNDGKVVPSKNVIKGIQSLEGQTVQDFEKSILSIASKSARAKP